MAVEIKFTNNNSTPVSFMQCAQIIGFQDGIQLHRDNMYLTHEYDWSGYDTQIKDGATITIFFPMPLNNTTSPVELKADILDYHSHRVLVTAQTTIE